jgi:NAD(P)-dependent dehydrogenase (short-subunit alcohol dehydrogenase family)
MTTGLIGKTAVVTGTAHIGPRSPRPAGRSGDPGDIANGVLFFASERSSWVTGQAIAIDGGDALL